jgi:Bacterial aa3 type cytochrome c oxidase subunit IV.
MDYSEHEATYSLFLKLLKYVAMVCVLILIFLAYMWG